MAKSSFYSGSQQVSANSNAVEDSKNAAALSEAAAAASAAAAATSAASGAASSTTATTKASESATSATASATSASASQASRVASEAAKVASEAAKTAAETARDAAAASSTSASSSQAAASTSEANAATSAAAALVSENAAAASAATAATEASDSATSAAASEVSNVASGVAKVAAETAETNAETAQAASEAARDASAASEANAATSETNAASSATAAASSASSASTSATSASNAQTAAESARDATLAAYDNFDDRYLGAKSSPPTVDNDGNALVAGSLFFDTTAGAMKVYTGSAWVAAYVSGTDYLPFSGGTMTGDVAYGDNVKATFGAGSDLQIYHDGLNSYINDAGTGELRIQANGLLDINKYTGENMARFFADGEVQLYHNNVQKLATKSTGIDVFGKILCDDELVIESTTGYGNIEIGGPSGAFIDLKSPFSDDYDGRIFCDGTSLDLATNSDIPVLLKHNNSEKMRTTSTGVDVTGTVSADDSFFLTGASDALVRVTAASGSNAELKLLEAGAGDVGANIQYDGTANELNFKVGNNLDRTRISIARDSGDISFYEDTGTTAKFFWDASAERLGIGTSSPNSLLYLYGDPQATSGAVATIRDSSATSSNTSFASILFSSSPGTDYAIGKSNVNTASTLSFRNANTGTSYVDIDSSGNLEMTGGGSVGWANFTFKEESGYLYVYNGSTKIMRVDASGNAAFAGDVEANATL